MVSINFTYGSLQLSMSLTMSQDVSRNLRLNVAFELIINYTFIQISIFLVIFRTHRTSNFERVRDWKMIRYICSYYRSFKVVIIDTICDYMINCIYCSICHSSRLIYCWYWTNWNIKLTKFWTFLFCSKSSTFMLKSPVKFTLLFLLNFLKEWARSISRNRQKSRKRRKIL